jgi:cystathionine gamma-lyase
MLDYSGMVTFYIKGDLECVKDVISRLKVCICAESLGGVESLCEVPAIMTHGSVPAEERIKLEIKENMIRVSVGIENTQDLIEDFRNALLIIQ